MFSPCHYPCLFIRSAILQARVLIQDPRLVSSNKPQSVNNNNKKEMKMSRNKRMGETPFVEDLKLKSQGCSRLRRLLPQL